MRKRFGEIATFSRGLTFSKGDVVSESSKRVLRSNNIDLATHSLVFDDIACLKEGFIIPDDKMLHRNDIFICMSNGSTQHLGKVAFISEEIGFAFGGFMGAIHPDESQIFPKYAFYACLSSEYRRFLSSIFNGININNLKWSDLSDFRIPTPPLAEQERIVAELDLLQGIIDKQKAQLKELDTLAQSIFYDMFGDPVENEKGWEIKTIGAVCAPKKDIRRAVKFFCKDDRISYIDISSIDNIKNVITTPTLYRFGDAPSRAQQVVEINDVLISLVRPNLNNVAIVSLDDTNLVASSGFCVLRASSIIQTAFLFFIVKMKSFTEYLMQRVSGANYPAVREDDITGYPMIVPPLPLQQSFATKIEAIERQKASINASIAETQKLFDYTMDKYFG